MNVDLGSENSFVRVRVGPHIAKIYVRLCRRDDRYDVRGFHFGFLTGRWSSGWGL